MNANYLEKGISAAGRFLKGQPTTGFLMECTRDAYERKRDPGVFIAAVPLAIGTLFVDATDALTKYIGQKK